MNQKNLEGLDFKAPWGKSLIWISWSCTIGLLGMVAFFLVMKMYFGIIIPVLILTLTAPFTIRRYTICSDQLIVLRLFTKTTLDLSGLLSVEFNPSAMAQSTRSAGNGGLFSFSGYFTSNLIGDYRALVTDPSLAVILRFPMETVVVSPENPQSFIDKLQHRTANA